MEHASVILESSRNTLTYLGGFVKGAIKAEKDDSAQEAFRFILLKIEMLLKEAEDVQNTSDKPS